MRQLQTLPSVQMRWQAVLANCAQALTHAPDIDAASHQIAQAINEAFPNTHMVVALGTLRDIVLLHAIPRPLQVRTGQTGTFLFSRPRLDTPEVGELSELLSSVARDRPGDGKRWWLIRECAPHLQVQLEKRFGMPGQGMLVPLRSSGEFFGFLFLASATLFREVPDARDGGTCTMILADMLELWLQHHAPMLLGTTAKINAVPLPLEGLAALSAVERITPRLAGQQRHSEALEALASSDPLADVLTLCLHVCTILQDICGADQTIALTNEHEEGFRVLCALHAEQIWTRQSLQGPNDSPVDSERWLLPWPDRFIARILSDPQPLHLRDASEVHALARTLSLLRQQSALILPVMVANQVTAIIVVACPQRGGFPDLELSVACTLAAIMGAIWQTQLATQERAMARSEVENVWEIASKITTQSLKVLANVTAAHGILAANQPEQLADLAERLAVALQLSPLEVFHIRQAALLCDIGMVHVPTSILRSEHELTTEQHRLIQQHPQASVDMLGELSVIKDILPLILHHHEQWDGTGYPTRLAGTAIPIGARILAVVDAYLSMQATRPYRPAFTAGEALEYLLEVSGTRFDPHIVRQFKHILEAPTS